MTLSKKKKKRREDEAVQVLTKPKIVYEPVKRKRGPFTKPELIELMDTALSAYRDVNIHSVRNAIKSFSKHKQLGRSTEDIYVMYVESETLRTDTGRVVRVDPKIWREHKKKKDPIVKFEIATGRGITKSGKKVSLTVKPEKTYKLRPDYDPVKREVKKVDKVVKPEAKVKLEKTKIEPLSKEEIQRIKETSVRQKQMLLEATQLYQDQLRATKFLSSAFKGKVKPFPKKGYSSHKIMEAYKNRKPKWKLHIRRDFHRDEVHMKFVAPNQYLQGREEVHREVRKVLVLMNMSMTPDATIRDVKPPRVGPKYRWIHVAVKAKKLGEGDIRSRGG
jgi:hypothetical protein